jgi:hypothetical protein
MIYIHVVENTMRAGVNGYRPIKTLEGLRELDRFLNKRGKPVWIIMTPNKSLASWAVLGGYREMYWNSGCGYASGYMPKL